MLDADHPVPCLVAADRHAVAGGLRLLASGDSDLHCGCADTGEPLPGHCHVNAVASARPVL